MAEGKPFEEMSPVEKLDDIYCNMQGIAMRHAGLFGNQCASAWQQCQLHQSKSSVLMIWHGMS